MDISFHKRAHGDDLIAETHDALNMIKCNFSKKSQFLSKLKTLLFQEKLLALVYQKKKKKSTLNRHLLRYFQNQKATKMLIFILSFT